MMKKRLFVLGLVLVSFLILLIFVKYGESGHTLNSLTDNCGCFPPAVGVAKSTIVYGADYPAPGGYGCKYYCDCYAGSVSYLGYQHTDRYSSCPSGSTNPGYTPEVCNDGLDNDNDGDIDYIDGSCFSCGSASSGSGSTSPTCDSWEKITIGTTTYTTCSQDCSSFPPLPQCSDGADNDGDGKSDYGTSATNDPGCADANDNDETDTAPPPPPTPVCGDGNCDPGEDSTNCPGDCPTTTTTLPPAQPECESLVEESNDPKFDVIFVGANFNNAPAFRDFLNNEVVPLFLKTEPFKTYKNKFNFRYVTQLATATKSDYEDLSSQYSQSIYAPKASLIRQVDKMVKMCDDSHFARRRVFFIDSNWPGTRGMDNKGIKVGDTDSYSNSDPIVILHESGHTICELSDEYYSGTRDITGINCDVDNYKYSDGTLRCPNFETYGIFNSCHKVCSYGDYARSTENSVMMGSISPDKRFNLISCASCVIFIEEGWISPGYIQGALNKCLAIREKNPNAFAE